MSTNESIGNTKKSNTPARAASVVASISIIIALASGAIGFFNFQNAQKSQQQLTQQTQTIETLQKTVALPQHAQNKSEVSYLIHLANLQLTLDKNAVAAKNTLTLALSKTHDNDALKTALTQNIAALNALPKLDTPVIFSQLAELNKKIYAISLLKDATKASAGLQKVIQDIQTTDTKNTPWYHRVWDHLKSVKQFFIVRHIDSRTMPLVDPELVLSTKLNLQMQITLAQWALLHHDQPIYQSALQSVTHTLNNYFSLAPTTASLVSEIDVLEKTNINPQLPSLDTTLSLLASSKTASMEQDQ